MAEIKKAKMAPFYRSVCKELKWKEDSKLWTEMTAENEVEIKALDEKIADAEANLGESEHRSVENFSIWLLFTFRSRECKYFNVLWSKILLGPGILVKLATYKLSL